MIELIIPAILLVCAIAWAEVKEWLPWFARKVLSAAIQAADAEHQDRLREELFAELAVVPGKLSPFAWACSIWWGFRSPTLFARLDVAVCGASIQCLDRILGVVLLAVTAPTILMVALAGRICKNRRAGRFVKQRLRGRNGVLFYTVRFQTRDLEDGKFLPYGLLMERTSLHRLPILYSILSGSMSLVGPPPQRADSDAPPLRLKPGIAWVQKASDAETEMFGKSTAITLRLYCSLIARTVVAALCKKG